MNLKCQLPLTEMLLVCCTCSLLHILCIHIPGGNFHLKVGGAKSSGNAGDPMLGVAVSGGSRIYKRGGIK